MTAPALGQSCFSGRDSVTNSQTTRTVIRGLEKCPFCPAWRKRGIELGSHIGTHALYDWIKT